ncbi:MAG: ABC transporter ATP-binding protein, partial [Paracoccus sp. (in: a-proteobacteria)]
EHPASPKVAEFLRLGAMLRLTRDGDGWFLGTRPLGPLGGPQTATAEVLVTPRALRITDPAHAVLTGEVMAVQYRETAYAVTVRLDGAAGPQLVQISSDTRMRITERVGLDIISDRLRWFPARTEPLSERG